MAFNPTVEQTAAMEEKGAVLVSAAAGSGKTAVLVERVIKMLLNRENPVFANRLLIVTFTNAAAAEMLSRIEARLFCEQEKNPEDELINRQIYLIKSADICTIDSFCILLVRDNFALCGIEPDFKVTDENSLYTVRSEVLSEILSEYLENPSEDFKLLLALAGCRYGEGELARLIDGIYIDSLKKPFSDSYIRSFKAPYDYTFNKDHVWQKYAFSVARKTVGEMKVKVERMAEAALYSEAVAKATVYTEVVSALVNDIEAAVCSGDFNTVFEAVRSAELAKLPPKSGEELKTLKGNVAAGIDKIRYFFSDKEEDISGDIERLSPAVELLISITETYREKLFSRLKEENVFSFDDVEQMAFSLLAAKGENGEIIRTPRADELIDRYDEVLVDEFQDVNDLQNALFELLSDNSRKLFIVGDVKQSIYAFRGSNPDIFLKKKDLYADYKTATGNAKRIFLSSNFRSRKGICDSVNYFFSKIMAGQAGDIVYGEDEKLKPKAEYPENNDTATDFLVIDKVDDDSKDSLVQTEACAICDYIKGVMSGGKLLKDADGGLREPAYGDFCILLATLKNKSGVIADILNKNGIPANVSDGSFFDSTEVSVALSLLHVIDNPQKDVYLLRLLMSPLYNFTAEDMAKIRLMSKNGSLYSALLNFAAEDEKTDKFLFAISEIRKMTYMLTLGEFVAYAFDKTDIINIFSSLPGGAIRAENLMKIMRLATEYSSGLNGSLYGFLKYVETLPESSLKTTVSTDDNCVRIMSIHGSKGLQFPICIVAGLSHKMNKSDSYYRCLYSGDYGIGFNYYDKSITDKRETLSHKILSEENLKRIAQERLRLLYVALTRAEEKLCLVCCLDNAEKALVRAADATDMGLSGIKTDFIMKAQDSAAYILAAAVIHPDAGILRQMANKKIYTSDTESRISVKFIDALDLSSAEGSEIKSPLPDSELADRIKQNMGYKYPFESLSRIPAKTSVSSIANREEIESFAMTDRPAFMEKEGLSAAGRGTATHKVMQYISLDGIPDIESEILRILSENRISETEAAAVDREALKRFFQSDVSKRIRNSETVKREMRFLTELPVSYYGAANDTDDKFILQGAVDLCFVEDGGVVVLDFKTDKVKQAEELKERYSAQLDIYAEACRKIFNLPVKEKIIYSFALSSEMKI
ncbi:MAG: helicase-exonuclease AddAB subunit AddA [Clostridia bacterium]|nr:helicase-exonuclease AddAB subunit AddA [Clostridia bacterium]